MVKEKTQLDEYKYLVAVIVGSVLVTTILVFLIGRPLYLSIRDTSKDLDDKLATVEKLETKLANLKNLESKKEELEEQNKTVLAALPEDKDVARLFVQFESIFNKSGATINSVSETSSSSQQGTSDSTGVIVPITYNVTGSVSDYPSLKTALSKLEGALRMLSITSIDVSGEAKDLNATFTINTYVRGQE